MGDFVAMAGARFSEHMAAKPEADLRATQLELQNDLFKKELDKAVAPPPEPTALMRGEPVRSAPAIADEAVEEDGPLGTPRGSDAEEGVATVTNPFDFDSEYYVNPLVKDAATAAERYGEPGELPAAFRTAISDMDYNANLKRVAKETRYTVEEIHNGVAAFDPHFIRLVFPRKAANSAIRAPYLIGDFNAGATYGEGYSPQWPAHTINER